MGLLNSLRYGTPIHFWGSSSSDDGEGGLSVETVLGIAFIVLLAASALVYIKSR